MVIAVFRSHLGTRAWCASGRLPEWYPKAEATGGEIVEDLAFDRWMSRTDYGPAV